MFAVLGFLVLVGSVVAKWRELRAEGFAMTKAAFRLALLLALSRVGLLVFSDSYYSKDYLYDRDFPGLLMFTTLSVWALVGAVVVTFLGFVLRFFASE